MEPDAHIAAAMAGNPQAFGLLVRRYQRPLFSFLGRIGLAQGPAEDIAQETFLRAWRHRSDFQPGRAQFATWLFAMARHLALNHLSSAGQRLVSSLDDSDEGSAQPPEARANPQDALDARQQHMRLSRAMHKLAFEDRSALGLAYVQELDMASIARIERCSVAAIKTRLHRAKLKLRDILEQDHEPT